MATLSVTGAWLSSRMRMYQNKRCSLQWRHNGLDGVSNHHPHHCLLSHLFGRRLKKTSKLRVTGLCAGNSPVTVNSPHKWPVTRKMFPFDENVSIWWRHHVTSVRPVTQVGLLVFFGCARLPGAGNIASISQSGPRFTNSFSISIQIRWKFFSLSPPF